MQMINTDKHLDKHLLVLEHDIYSQRGLRYVFTLAWLQVDCSSS